MAEPGDPFQIMTQYPEGKPAYSPRLLAPKPPIINIPTTPTSAMNRAGTGLKNPDLDHRMEYFDPKTRPQAIFLDEEALLSAPPELIRSTATTVFASLVGAMAQLDINPLAEGDRNHAFRLAHRAYPRLVDELDNPPCASISASRRSCRTAPRTTGPAGSGAARSPATTRSRRRCMCAIRMSGRVSRPRSSMPRGYGFRKRSMRDRLGRLRRRLEVWRDGMDARQAALAVADVLEAHYTRVGVPTRLRQLQIPREDFRAIANDTVKNFNANAGERSPADQVEDAMRLLEAAY